MSDGLTERMELRLSKKQYRRISRESKKQTKETGMNISKASIIRDAINNLFELWAEMDGKE